MPTVSNEIQDFANLDKSYEISHRREVIRMSALSKELHPLFPLDQPSQDTFGKKRTRPRILKRTQNKNPTNANTAQKVFGSQMICSFTVGFIHRKNPVNFNTAQKHWKKIWVIFFFIVLVIQNLTKEIPFKCDMCQKDFCH